MNPTPAHETTKRLQEDQVGADRSAPGGNTNAMVPDESAKADWDEV